MSFNALRLILFGKSTVPKPVDTGREAVLRNTCANVKLVNKYLRNAVYWPGMSSEIKVQITNRVKNQYI